ncbi:MAG: PQQ-like beta-propeller repeat protein [Mariniblastus sp.]|nr:PQQ-like beta-propeller repeat protein [Mariniblastus sp.]MDG2182506.1 PQQ-like beta-propeller repeat protein [Mariniblastus sp.]
MRFTIRKNVSDLMLLGVAFVCLTGGLKADDGVTSSAVIQRAGLTVDWFTHSGVGINGGLADWQINVDENKPTTFFSLEANKFRERISQNTLNSFGEPFGVDGARQYMQVRSEVLKAEFANDGVTDVEIKISEYTLPQTTIYTLGTNAVVSAVDADTGATKWTSSIGDPRLPSIGVAASNEFVAAINGLSVYCLEASTGKIVWSGKCRFAPSTSPAITETGIYVPLLNGRLESFALKDKGQNSQVLVSGGRSTARPLVTDYSVSWPNSKGRLTVAGLYTQSKGVAYQLNSDDAIMSPTAYNDGMFYVTSLDGFVYAMNEPKGVIDWQVSTGFGISQPAIVLNDHVYVINSNNEMFKLIPESGKDAPGWEQPLENIGSYVGAGKDNMYVLDSVGNLCVIDQDSGAILSKVEIGGVQSVLPNMISDRMYIVSDRGMIQCLREINSRIPFFHSNELAEFEKNGGKTKKDELDDPFALPKKGGGDLDNPFGAPRPKDNPFGGGGGGGNSADDDPFK